MKKTIHLVTVFAAMLLAAAMLFLALPINAIAASVNSRRKLVNVVFVLDATGSMGEEINNVKINLSDFATYLSKSGGLDELRFGLVEYRDIAEGDATVVYKNTAGSPWFTDVDELTSRIGSISVSGGGDEPETVYDGLGYLVCGADHADALLFNSDAYKFAFVLTDASAKITNNFGITGMSDMVSRLKAAGIYTSVVCPTDLEDDYRPLYNYAPDGAVVGEDGSPMTGIWMNINNSDFSVNMQEFAENILSVVRPEIVELSLNLGARHNFAAYADVYLDHPGSATYATDDPAVIELSDLMPSIGTAVGEGKCTVTITDGTKSVEVEVTVTEDEIAVPVKELKISAEVYVGVDQSIHVKAVALPEEASEKGLIWSVVDNTVVEIESYDENYCYLKGLRSGTTTLSALTKDGGYSGSTQITVTIDPIIPVDGVEVSMSDCTMEVGDSKTATASVLPAEATNKGGYWYSSDSDIVRIVTSDKGNCTFEAVSCGEARVYYVSDEGGYSEAIEVTVPHNATWIETKTPSCDSDGERSLICDSCHEILETELIPTTISHEMSGWTPVESDDGIMREVTRSCIHCGKFEERKSVGVSLTTEEVSARYGDTVELRIGLKADSFLAGMQLTLDYDGEYFDVQGVSLTSAVSSPLKDVTVDRDSQKISITFAGTENLTDELVLLTLKLKVVKNVVYEPVRAIRPDTEGYLACYASLDGNQYPLEVSFGRGFGVVKLLGPDPNGDGSLDIRDLYVMMEALRAPGYDPHDEALIAAMDCNFDGKFDIADVMELQTIVAYMD